MYHTYICAHLGVDDEPFYRIRHAIALLHSTLDRSADCASTLYASVCTICSPQTHKCRVHGLGFWVLEFQGFRVFRVKDCQTLRP